MKNFDVKKLLFLLLVVPALSFAQCADDESFSEFYKQFQAAVAKDDAKEVAKLTQFPFKVREVLSDETPMKISKEQFVRYYRYMTQLPVKQSPSTKASTQRKLIISTAELKEGEHFSCTEINKVRVLSNKARVGLFDFSRRKGGQWRLSDAMIGGELYSNIEEDSEPVN